MTIILLTWRSLLCSADSSCLHLCMFLFYFHHWEVKMLVWTKLNVHFEVDDTTASPVIQYVLGCLDHCLFVVFQACFWKEKKNHAGDDGVYHGSSWPIYICIMSCKCCLGVRQCNDYGIDFLACGQAYLSSYSSEFNMIQKMWTIIFVLIKECGSSWFCNSWC